MRISDLPYVGVQGRVVALDRTNGDVTPVAAEKTRRESA
jgi:hypothetical protein